MPTAQSTSTSKRTEKPKKPTLHKPKTKTGKFITAEQRYNMIAEAAYFIAEKRGFNEGDPEYDWFRAESEIDQMLTNQ